MWWLLSLLYPWVSAIVLSITEWEVLRSPTVIVELSVSPFKSGNFYLMYFVAVLFDTYTFKMITSGYCILTLVKQEYLCFVSWVKFLSFDCFRTGQYLCSYYWFWRTLFIKKKKKIGHMMQPSLPFDCDTEFCHFFGLLLKFTQIYK